MNANVDVNDPKVIELSFHVLETIILKTDEKKLDEVIKVAEVMNELCQSGNYPEELKFAYSDALTKLGTLNDDLLKDLREMLKADD